MNKPDPTEKKYCAAKHYMKYIRPGAVRVAATGDSGTFFASAFVHDADKSLTIVLLNTGKTAEPVRPFAPDFSRASSRFNVRAHQQDPKASAALPDLSSNLGAATLELPPRSIVTLVGIGTGEPPTAPTVPTNLLSQPLNESVTLTWTAGWHADSYSIKKSTPPSTAPSPSSPAM